MAKNISCTVDVRCWKQRTCTACGGVFSYIFARKIAGMGPTREAAAAAMEANAVKQVMTDASSHPCPTCGLYQPDMVAARRVTAQGWLFAVSIPAMLLLLILNVSNTVQDNLIVPAAAGIMVVVGLLQLVFDARRPNRDLEANRQLAQRSIERQLLRVDTPGRAQQGMEVPWSTQGSMGSLNAMGAPSVAGVSSSTGGGVVPLALFVIGLTAVLVPPIVRESRGWPFNPVAFPPIVGPGDSTRFYTQHSLRSIDGKFRAEADAVATPKGGGAEFPLVAKSNQDNWGDTIQVESGKEDTKSQLWVTLTIPDQPELAGKEIDCRINLRATYPKADGDHKTYHTEEQTFNDSLTLHLGPPNSGSEYETIWWAGFAGGMGLFLLSGLVRVMRAKRAKSQGAPAV